MVWYKVPVKSHDIIFVPKDSFTELNDTKLKMLKIKGTSNSEVGKQTGYKNSPGFTSVSSSAGAVCQHSRKFYGPPWLSVSFIQLPDNLDRILKIENAVHS
jgi:hypothetical protein